jgi:hypothetical protein
VASPGFPRFLEGFLIRRATDYRGVEQPGSCQAHNLKVIGSNPIPATKFDAVTSTSKKPLSQSGFLLSDNRRSATPLKIESFCCIDSRANLSVGLNHHLSFLHRRRLDFVHYICNKALQLKSDRSGFACLLASQIGK